MTTYAPPSLGGSLRGHLGGVMTTYARHFILELAGLKEAPWWSNDHLRQCVLNIYPHVGGGGGVLASGSGPTNGPLGPVPRMAP